MKVRWTYDAEQDRDSVWDYISADNPKAGVRMDALFTDATAILADFPTAGYSGRVPGTRELIPHESYRLVYEIAGDTVWVLALIHTARQWPPIHE